MKQILLLISILFFIVGCSSNREKVLAKVKKISAEKDFTTEIYHTKNFEIFTIKKITDLKKDLRIYIEGDGFAYRNKHTPSVDPTPVSYFLINLVFQDNSPNILYIARPCQYVSNKNCTEKYWTNQRFSREIIDAIDEVIRNFPDQKYELIGYSGGATIINHLNHHNTKNIRTIAGNLDLKTFSKIHKIFEIAEEKINYEQLSKIPQIHFVGNEDKIIPLDIFASYQKNLPKKNCTKLQVIDGASHSAGWQNNSEFLLLLKDDHKISELCSK